MAWIVDAYNALSYSHLLPGAASEVGAVGLAGLMHRAEMDRRGATVVADGSPKPDDRAPIEVGKVRVIFSGPGVEADSIIEELIAESHSPRGLTVVSNDRRLIAAAKRRRATSMSSEAFMRRLAGQLVRSEEREREEGRAVEGQVDVGADYWYGRMWAEGQAGEVSEETSKHLDRDTDRWMREFGFEGDERDERES